MADASRCWLLLTPGISSPQGKGQTASVSFTVALPCSLPRRIPSCQADSTKHLQRLHYVVFLAYDGLEYQIMWAIWYQCSYSLVKRVAFSKIIHLNLFKTTRVTDLQSVWSCWSASIQFSFKCLVSSGEILLLGMHQTMDCQLMNFA